MTDTGTGFAPSSPRQPNDRISFACGSCVVALLLTSCVGIAGACSVFALRGEQGLVVGRNLDWHRDIPGLVVLNPRGVEKTVLPWHGDEPAARSSAPAVSWTSRYGSVAFTAYARDFIEGGMNEAGLVISQAASEGSYPPEDGRAGVSCAQWMQFLLDRFATVAEVVSHLGDLRVDGEGWHVLVADAGGRCAVVEHGPEGPIVFEGGPQRPCVITNATYARALEHLPLDTAFGGRLEIAGGRDSYGRFVRCAALMREGGPGSGSDLTRRAEAILKAVADEDTRRMIVYDPVGRRVRWTTKAHRRTRWIDLGGIEFASLEGCGIQPVDGNLSGDATGAFKPFTGSENFDIARAALAAIYAPIGPDADLGRIDESAAAVAFHPTGRTR